MRVAVPAVLGALLPAHARAAAGALSVRPIGSVPLLGSLLFNTKQLLLARSGACLALFVACTIVGGGLVYSRVTGTRPLSAAAFKAYSLLNDIPGADATDEESTAGRLVAVTLHLVGVLTFAILLGVVSDNISSAVDRLRTSNAPVMESGHTLLVNWGGYSKPVLRQLASARKDGRLPCGRVVILADMPKEELDEQVRVRALCPRGPVGVTNGRAHSPSQVQDELAKAGSDLSGLQISTRQGSPRELADLQRACAGTARRVIVTPPATADPDDYADGLRESTGLVLALQARSPEMYPRYASRRSTCTSSPSRRRRTRSMHAAARLWSSRLPRVTAPSSAQSRKS